MQLIYSVFRIGNLPSFTGVELIFADSLQTKSIQSNLFEFKSYNGLERDKFVWSDTFVVACVDLFDSHAWCV